MITEHEPAGLGRPRKHDKAGSLTNIHCRVPTAMKAHWQAFIEGSVEYNNLTDMVIALLNGATGYIEDDAPGGMTVDDL